MSQFNNHIAFLVKFIPSEYINSLVNDGHLFMNNVEYFKALENEDIALRGDKNEGIAASYNSNDVIIKLVGQEIKAVYGNIDIRKSHDQKTNIYCMAVITAQDVIDAGGELKLSEKFKKFGDKALIIPGQNVKEFIARIKNHIGLNPDIISHHEHRTLANKVEYISKDYQGDIGIYRKYNEYSWQHEWRIAIKQTQTLSAYEDFKIGSIKDISYVVNTSELIDETIGIKELLP